MTVSCPDCGLECRSKAGLASHRRAKHPVEAGGGRNLVACRQTLSELGRLGRLEKIDQARVTAVESMAAALDDNPFNAQMWREYREALERLTADDGDDGSLEELLQRLSAPVGD